MVPPGFQLTAGLRGVDHLDRDAVLELPPGLRYSIWRRPSQRPGALPSSVEPAGVADEVADVARNSHGSIVAGPNRAPTMRSARQTRQRKPYLLFSRWLRGCIRRSGAGIGWPQE